MNDAAQLRLCKTIFVIAMVNFAAFFLESMYFGGDAINGMIREGRYYLGSHGKYKEVSEAIFVFSKWHVYSFWCTHLLAMLAGAWFLALRSRTGAGRPPAKGDDGQR
jgi:hypothetical protein